MSTTQNDLNSIAPPHLPSRFWATLPSRLGHLLVRAWRLSMWTCDFIFNGHIVLAAGRWVIVVGGRIATTALFFAALWISARNSAPAFVASLGVWFTFLPVQVTDIDNLARLAFTMLPEIILFQAIIATYEQVELALEGKGKRGHWIWAVLYALPTTAFFCMAVYTFLSFVTLTNKSQPSQMSDIATVIRAMSGWIYALVEMLYAGLNKRHRHPQSGTPDVQGSPLPGVPTVNQQEFTANLLKRVNQQLAAMSEQFTMATSEQEQRTKVYLEEFTSGLLAQVNQQVYALSELTQGKPEQIKNQSTSKGVPARVRVSMVNDAKSTPALSPSEPTLRLTELVHQPRSENEVNLEGSADGQPPDVHFHGEPSPVNQSGTPISEPNLVNPVGTHGSEPEGVYLDGEPDLVHLNGTLDLVNSVGTHGSEPAMVNLDREQIQGESKVQVIRSLVIQHLEVYQQLPPLTVIMNTAGCSKTLASRQRRIVASELGFQPGVEVVEAL